MGIRRVVTGHGPDGKATFEYNVVINQANGNKIAPRAGLGVTNQRK